MNVQQLIDALSMFPPKSDIHLAIRITIGGAPAYKRGQVVEVNYLPTSFYGNTRLLCILGETENGNQSSLDSVQQ
jgi:hypothetical protein